METYNKLWAATYRRVALGNISCYYEIKHGDMPPETRAYALSRARRAALFNIREMKGCLRHV